MSARVIEYLNIDGVLRAEVNPKGHAAAQITASVNRFGFIDPMVLDERTGRLVSGHGRLDELARAREAGEPAPDGVEVDAEGFWLAPVVRGWASADDAEAVAAGIAINQLTIAGGWEVADLTVQLAELQARPLGLEGIGFDSDDLARMLAELAQPDGGGEGDGGPSRDAPSLADRFIVPPFSVFDARQGYWQDRKRHWLSLGIRSEEGRAHNLLKMSDTVLAAQSKAPNRSVPNSNSGNDPAYYWKKQEAERVAGHELSIEEFEADWYTADAYVGGTSIFDPVLCEIVYRWWCPEHGRVLDPFAGGSVRGVVAALLQREYVGIDLSGVQVEANEAQAAELLAPLGRETASWLVGDSAQVLPALEAEPFDLVFSCPPYFDLERYSDDPNDLSNADTYEAFLESYRKVIAQSVARLAPDRFACFVVGDIRGPDGAYRGFVPDTIAAFADAGAAFYNEVVLVTAVGSLALRAARIFGGARKVAKAHQNVLVFVKGDPMKAGQAAAEFTAADLSTFFDLPA